MMKKDQTHFIVSLIFLYLFFAVILIRSTFLSKEIFWSFLLLVFIGFGSLFYLLFVLKKGMKNKQESLSPIQPRSLNLDGIGGNLSKQAHALMRELGEKNQNEKTLLKQIDHLNLLHAHQENKFMDCKQDLQSQINKKEIVSSEYRSTIQEQRIVIEKKQEEINVLHMRLNDLKYEVEPLLKDKESYFSVREEMKQNREPLEKNVLDESLQKKLDRYIQLISHLSSANHFASKASHSLDFSLKSLTIDQRRLFDRLENEEFQAILVYSREEGRLIFVNQEIKHLTGWSAEKFLQDFSFLILKGLQDWQEALEDLKLEGDRNVRLLIKTRSGRDLLTHCYLKEVPSGTFQGHIIGIVAPATGLDM